MTILLTKQCLNVLLNEEMTAKHLALTLNEDYTTITKKLKKMAQDGSIMICGRIEYRGKWYPVYTAKRDKMSIKVYQMKDDEFWEYSPPRNIVSKRDWLVEAFFGS